MLACLFALSLFTVRGQAQYVALKFDAFGTDQGLSNQVVNCSFRDSMGFLWVGTAGGLNRFDGYEFKVFLPDPKRPDALRDGSITAIFEDKNRNLWIGTKAGGLHWFDRRTETFRVFQAEKKPDAFPDNRVYRFFGDADGTLWIGTSAGLCRLKSFDAATGNAVFETFKNDPKNPQSLGHNRVLAMARDRNGVLWIGTRDGLYRMTSENPPSFEAFRNDPNDPTSLPDNEVYALNIDSEGNLWGGMWGGSGIFELPVGELNAAKPKFRKFPVEKGKPGGFSGEVVFDIHEDRAGTLWFCGQDSGLYALLKSERGKAAPEFIRFAADDGNPFSLKKGLAYSMFEDAQGLLWISGNEGGLSRLDPVKSAFRLFRHHPEPAPGLMASESVGVVEDRDGAVWVAEPVGLDRISGPPETVGTRVEFTHFRKDEKSGLKDDAVSSLLLDSKGRLWCGTLSGGLFLRENSGFRQFQKDEKDPESLGSNTVLTLAEDRSGNIWVGTYGGVYRLVEPATPGGPVKFVGFRRDEKNPASLSNNTVESLCVGADGAVWVGTTEGLNRFDAATGTFKRFLPDPENPNTLVDRYIQSLYAARDGSIWVGTRGGLCRIDSAGTVTRIGKDSVPAIEINAITEDENGQIWCGTVGGLFRLDPKTGSSRRFGKGDGLPSDLFNRGAVGRGRNGRLYFGTPEGLIAFRPDEVEPVEPSPRVALTNFLLENRVQAIRPETVLPVAPELLPELTVRYSDNLFTLEFSALDFRRPEGARYQYKVDNLYDHWIETDSRNRRATFTNLQPGEYVLRIRAAGPAGFRDDGAKTLKIVVLPPWWRTTWAYGIFAILCIGSLYGGFRWRVAALEARNRELNEKVAERTAALDRNLKELEQAKLETEAKNRALDETNTALDRKVLELKEKNEELEASHKRADRIFSALAQALPGTVLEGKYRLDEKIGSGGFATVFRGTHLRLNCPIAVKIFRPVSGNDSPEAVERFRLEGVSTARLKHPNVVGVFDSGISEGGIAFLVMELLEGESLADELRRTKQMSLRRCVNLVLPVCAALAEAHRLGIVHRDIKPDNIFIQKIGEEEIVKVVDFGIAKFLEGEEKDREKLTAAGSIVGTPKYISPERLSNLPYDGRADVYSLGVMVFEMLTGRTPFQGSGHDVISLILEHLKSAPPSIRRFQDQIPPEVDDVIQLALAKVPAERPTALEFGIKLAEAVGDSRAATTLEIQFTNRETMVGRVADSGDLVDSPTVSDPWRMTPVSHDDVTRTSHDLFNSGGPKIQGPGEVGLNE
jgi:ligand-binding sensor domain-containing protein/serine/threonine protein kinase